ncbi:MAG: ATP synthase F1 subunit epsilon [Candidatus Dojkabacteria bacterium]|nr:ATP synthase F1 subunit epsilon [Candidatus Dojkabacteria bacterium]MDQ7020931.1 ATP synthase F1 subunit epsilon [Candidatus Dojkabacteria bacterium]
MILKVVTPEGRTFEGEKIKSITLPTSSGVITVMDEHVPLLSIITPGGIEITTSDGEVHLLAVSRGVLEVRRNSIIDILADTAERAEVIDIERAEEAKKRAEEYLKKMEDIADIEFARLQAKIQKELARIQIGKKWKKLK